METFVPYQATCYTALLDVVSSENCLSTTRGGCKEVFKASMLLLRTSLTPGSSGPSGRGTGIASLIGLGRDANASFELWIPRRLPKITLHQGLLWCTLLAAMIPCGKRLVVERKQSACLPLARNLLGKPASYRPPPAINACNNAPQEWPTSKMTSNQHGSNAELPAATTGKS